MLFCSFGRKRRLLHTWGSWTECSGTANGVPIALQERRCLACGKYQLKRKAS